MSQVRITFGRFKSGDFVRTSNRRVGRVVEVRVELARHELDYYYLDGDEPMEHVYVCEFVDQWGEPFTEPWPEDLLVPATPLETLASS